VSLCTIPHGIPYGHESCPLCFFYFYFLSHVLVVKYKKQHGALAMAETKL